MEAKFIMATPNDRLEQHIFDAAETIELRTLGSDPLFILVIPKKGSKHIYEYENSNGKKNTITQKAGKDGILRLSGKNKGHAISVIRLAEMHVVSDDSKKSRLQVTIEYKIADDDMLTLRSERVFDNVEKIDILTAQDNPHFCVLPIDGSHSTTIIEREKPDSIGTDTKTTSMDADARIWSCYPLVNIHRFKIEQIDDKNL